MLHFLFSFPVSACPTLPLLAADGLLGCVLFGCRSVGFLVLLAGVVGGRHPRKRWPTGDGFFGPARNPAVHRFLFSVSLFWAWSVRLTRELFQFSKEKKSKQKRDASSSSSDSEVEVEERRVLGEHNRVSALDKSPSFWREFLSLFLLCLSEHHPFIVF